MNLEDKLRKSILHVPDELVGDASVIRYEDTWWTKHADGEWKSVPTPDLITGPYLDLTPGMGDALYNPDGTRVDDDAEDEQAED